MPLKFKKQIAAEYGVSPKTLANWLAKHEVIIGRGYLDLPKQKMIYELLGYPDGVDAALYRTRGEERAALVAPRPPRTLK